MADVFCNSCGHRNPLGANFCSSCGASLERDTGDRTTTAAFKIEPTEADEPELGLDLGDIPAGAGLLVVTRGPNAGSRLAVNKAVTTVGRHPDSDIFLDDITVSRRHCELHKTREGFMLKDVGSLNGTYLNRGRVEEAALGHGDELQIGKFKLVFFGPPSEGQPAHG